MAEVLKEVVPHRCSVSLYVGSSPGLSQETASWLGVCVWCRCIGGLCSSGCCPGCQELSAEWHGKLNARFGSFLKPERTVFLFVIMAIIFFFIAKSNLKNASVLPARLYTLRRRAQLHKWQGKFCFKSYCDEG